MMIIRMSFLLGATVWLAACSGPAAADEPPGYLKKDLAELTDALEGRWDSDRHNFFAEDAGLDASVLAPRQHIIIERLADKGEADAGRFTATRRVEGEADAVLTHAFSVDGEALAVRQEIEGVGCDVLWRRSGAQFAGEASGDGCDALFPRPEADGPLSVSMTLSETEFWVTAQRGDARSEARMRKARPFECWVAVLRGEEHGTTGAGKDDWYFTRGVLLHDQYGEAIVETDEDPARQISLRLRNVEWTYGTNRPSLSFYIHEAGNDRAISYAWAEYDAERIGINLRWLQASCTHAPDKVFEDF